MNRRHATQLQPRHYELTPSQVVTPVEVVRLFWTIVHRHRPRLQNVLDLGAGDGRFANFGRYSKYLGVEIDPLMAAAADLPANARLKMGDAFSLPLGNHDACIGNPPYVKHHDLDSRWKLRTCKELGDKLDAVVNAHGNLFLYFLALSLIRTVDTGLVALIVPFDWTSRPSAKWVRTVISRNKWDVSIYRFSRDVFSDVSTTVSISIIDKSNRSGSWKNYNISEDFAISPRRGLTGSGKAVLPYARRNSTYTSPVHARRGISAGSQDIFVLTEGQRLHHGLRLTDVRPCVTTLRKLPVELRNLDKSSFDKHFVSAGRKCWLIRSNEPVISDRLERYLKHIPPHERNTATCLKQLPWYNYERITAPGLLLHSSFSGNRPRALVNALRAMPVGTMYGIYTSERNVTPARVLTFLSLKNVRESIVPHSGRLRKIEVGQLNSLLSAKWPGRQDG